MEIVSTDTMPFLQMKKLFMAYDTFYWENEEDPDVTQDYGETDCEEYYRLWRDRL
jgi:hypothetical protein